MSIYIYDQMVAAKTVLIDHHESDLYVPVNPESTAIVNGYEFKGNVTTFISNVDKKPWYDIPFAYSPWWQNKA
jgi:hypothetical protein